MTHSAILEINLNALVANYRECERLSGKAKTGAAVKADAYGLGLRQVSLALFRAGCRHFFVAHFEEGVLLHKIFGVNHSGIKIFILNGYIKGKKYEEFKLTPVINSLEELKAYKKKPPALMVDTGMNRLGVRPEEAVDAQFILSHLACADTPDHPLNAKQITAMRDLGERFPNARLSLSNSEGIKMGENFHLTRPGIALYDGLHNVVTLKAPVLQTRLVKKGESIGYGATFIAQEDMLVSIVSLGYADGFMRAGEGGEVKIHNVLCPIVGRISMDLTAIDTSIFKDNHIEAGTMVTFIDNELRPSRVAKQAGTISYELLTRLGNRLKKLYV
jgi:alanine racemase